MTPMAVPRRNRRAYLPTAGSTLALAGCRVTAHGYATEVHAWAVLAAVGGGPRPVAATR
jgi:hypothetical protein